MSSSMNKAATGSHSITSTPHWWHGLWRAILPTLALCTALLAACNPGHSGADEIAFLRAGALWTISPDGSNLNQIETGGFVGVAWSPDHHQIVLRMPHGALTPPASPFGQGDSISELGVTAIDGGNIIQITPPNSGLLRSDAWWDASGNRLLYREESAGGDGATAEIGTPQWKLSQADQPAGIARKDLPASIVLPAVNHDGRQIATIDASGNVWLGAPGQAPRLLASDALTILPGSFYPARPLWQPDTGYLLYVVASSTPDATTLLLSDTNGHRQSLLTIGKLQQYAWSPDGQHLLLRTASDFRIYSASGVEQLSWDAAAPSLPFWSPDSRFVLLLSPDGISLVSLAARAPLPLLLRGSIALPPAPSDATQASILRPASSSPWKSDSSAFLFLNDGQGLWTIQPDHPLAQHSGPGDGLYSSTLDASGSAAHFPTLLDWGEHQSITWSTLDPNCAFLIV
jgi:hypothetical protein